jgi:hypothetical protein
MTSYNKHLVAFVDFLGFREAVRDPFRADSILRLLTTLAVSSGDFDAQSENLRTGGQRATVRPAISAFSDNIVISSNLDEVSKHDLGITEITFFLEKLIAFIAWNAFQSRLLIRGGIAVGDLYHKAGIVYGPALVEAYNLENALANYPRAPLGPSITSEGIERIHHRVSHHDGVTCLNCLEGFVPRTTGGIGPINLQIKTWIAEVRSAIAVELDKLSKTENLRASSKWHWFSSQFQEQIARMPEELINCDTPTPGRGT